MLQSLIKILIGDPEKFYKVENLQTLTQTNQPQYVFRPKNSHKFQK